MQLIEIEYLTKITPKFKFINSSKALFIHILFKNKYSIQFTICKPSSGTNRSVPSMALVMAIRVSTHSHPKDQPRNKATLQPPLPRVPPLQASCLQELLQFALQLSKNIVAISLSVAQPQTKGAQKSTPLHRKILEISLAQITCGEVQKIRL